MGVGQNTSNYLAPSIVWLLKDGAGMIGRIIFAWGFAVSLDADCKRWHFFGDILNDVACILDLITPYFQSVLLFISSISNICRAITGVIHSSTRTVIFQVRLKTYFTCRDVHRRVIEEIDHPPKKFTHLARGTQ
jgi:hypothetical protein